MPSLPKTLSLAGIWRFQLDRDNRGIRDRWFARSLDGAIQLPGTTDEAGFGDLTDEVCEDRLSRVYRWIGPAWYQTTVHVVEEWAGKKIFLFLERTKDCQVWVDDQWAGSDDSLSASHEFDLSKHLTPGDHTLTILVDNAKLPPVGPCHQVDERTQTNWNGIVGRIELSVREPVYIRSVQVYPNLPPANIPNPHDDEPIELGLNPGERTIEVVAEIVNDARWSGKGTFTFSVQVIGRESEFAIPSVTKGMLVAQGRQLVKATMIIPADVPCWDEFDPSLIRITVESDVMPRAERLRDRMSITCGLRSFAATRGQFQINGRTTFLRGKNDCALFPITGYAPMDKGFWLKFLGIGRDYGMNHYRFHSWCPPEAAFAAADELGIYFQVELPNKRGITAPDNRNYTPPAEAYETLDELKGDAGDPALRTAYLTREGEKILRQFGNHPSFVMLTLGNEIGGDEHVMKAMTDHFRKLDDRHFYALGTNAFHWDLRHRAGNDFWVIKGTREETHIRGASWDKKCHIDHQPPSTTKTYTDSLHGVPVPVIAHETAQYEVYPDYSEIGKYTGVLRAKNLEIFRDRLDKAGMLDQAKDFQRASGALSMVCRKEDVEAEIRTPGMAGFQLLDIQDFSGQGTALVGILDVFMDSKGLTTPEAWREFCCEAVPLLIMKKYTWTSDEVFRARIQVAHYGPKDLQQQRVTWSLRTTDAVVAGGAVEVDHIRTGGVTEIDIIHAPLASITAATQLELAIELTGTPYRNRYDVWVYPAIIDTRGPAGVTVARAWTDDVKTKLQSGENVLLLLPRRSLKRTVEMSFQTGFWSPMFRMDGRVCPATGGETPGTQGLLLDPNHPVFRHFPTQFHSNWQWWHMCKSCDPMILDATPHTFRPILQVIDGIDRNHKLGLILEARVGHAKLMVCTIDLISLQSHPEARQLLASLYRYVESDAFDPRHTLDISTLETIL